VKILKVLALIIGILLLAAVVLGLRGRSAATAMHETEARLLSVLPDSVDLEGGQPPEPEAELTALHAHLGTLEPPTGGEGTP